MWSSRKRDIQSKCLSHCKQQYHREAFRTTTKEEHTGWNQRKERALRFHNLTSSSVYLADDESYCCRASQCSLGLHWSLTVVGLTHITQSVCVQVCPASACLCVSVYACHHKRVVGCYRDRSFSLLHVNNNTVQLAVSPTHHSTMMSLFQPQTV